MKLSTKMRTRLFWAFSPVTWILFVIGVFFAVIFVALRATAEYISETQMESWKKLIKSVRPANDKTQHKAQQGEGGSHGGKER